MHRYETLFILHPEIPEAQVRETLDRVRRLIEGMQGQIAEIQDWGIRDLAYPIRKQPRGTYILAQYSARPEVVKELERNLWTCNKCGFHFRISAEERLQIVEDRVRRPALLQRGNDAVQQRRELAVDSIAAPFGRRTQPHPGPDRRADVPA